PGADLLGELVTVAGATLEEPVNGGFSGPRKRQLLGEFARLFFAADTAQKHDDLPISLLKTLSASTYNAEPLPKEPRPARKKKQPVIVPAEDTIPPEETSPPMCCPA